MEDTDQVHKPHNAPKAGAKARKKAEKVASKKGKAGQSSDPRAFSIQRVGKVRRKVMHALDKETRRHHAPIVNRTPDQPPPLIISVVGPPQVGKSTLIRSLVKRFTKQTINEIKGPVTVVAGKNRRYTFFECKNDMHSMLDLAKICDVALLMIDGSFGFEMETFEFLNMLMAHGMPRIMGVLTQLDRLRTQRQVRRRKKELKARFQSEISARSNLFYFSGISKDLYPQRETINLARFLSVLKPKVVRWRNTHPYLLADRVEDITDPEDVRQNRNIDRNISMYGYVRGTYLRPGQKVHMPGGGDFTIDSVTLLRDPCPAPSTKEEMTESRRRRLDDKDRIIYAPMSDVGGILFDRDATYIEMPDAPTAAKERHRAQPGVDYDDPRAQLLQELKERTVEETQDVVDGAMAPKTLDEELAVDQDSDGNGDQDTDEDEDEDEDGEDKEEGKGGVKFLSVEEAKDSIKDGVVGLDGEIQLFSGAGSVSLSQALASENQRRKQQQHEEQAGASSDSSSDEESDGEEDGSVSSSGAAAAAAGANPRTKHKEERVSSGGRIRRRVVFNDRSTDSKAQEDLQFEGDDEDGKGMVHTAHGSSGSGSSDDDDEEEESEEESEDEDGEDKEEPDFRDIDDGDDDSDDDDGGARWKEGMMERAAREHESRHIANLHELVYGKLYDDVETGETSDGTKKNKEQDNDDDFLTIRNHNAHEATTVDSSRLNWGKRVAHDWGDEELITSLKNHFVTGKWHEDEDAATLLAKHKASLEAGDSDGDGDGDGDSGDEEGFGDFEDLETGEVYSSSKSAAAATGGENGADEDAVDKEGEGEGEEEEEEGEDGKKPKSALTPQQKRELKKARMKALFDEEYDRVTGGGKTHFDQVKDELAERVKFNMDEFADDDEALRVQYEGYRPGLYVRVEVHGVPMELVEYFDPHYPYVLGGVLPQEEEMGFIQIRFKRHRFYQRRLKNRDPVIMSMGWRRFQATPLYASQDDNHRHRLLKVTPDHVHCIAAVYAPFVDPGVGCVTIVNSGEMSADFRVTGTGTVVQMDKTSDIVKKLKLVGYPMKVVKNTAFIKGMFNSALEVAKFQGAKIRTVSGIRGQIKRAIRAPEGAFRAAFEDRILMSDVVSLRTWYPVTPPKFYNPVLSLLLPDKESWHGMRSTWVLRVAKNLPTPYKKDSEYRKIHRKERRFNTLKIPKQLQAALPFKSKPKMLKARKKPTYETRRAVVMTGEERKRHKLLQELATIRNDMNAKRKATMAKRKADYAKRMERDEVQRTRTRKEKMRDVYRQLGKEERRRMIAQGRVVPPTKRHKGGKD